MSLSGSFDLEEKKNVFICSVLLVKKMVVLELKIGTQEKAKTKKNTLDQSELEQKTKKVSNRSLLVNRIERSFSQSTKRFTHEEEQTKTKIFCFGFHSERFQ